MGTRGQRVGHDKRRKFTDRLYRVPLVLRRAAAGMVTLSIALAVVFLGIHMEAHFDRAGEAVRTQEHQWSIIIDKEPRSRGGCTYYVLVKGQKVELHAAHLLPDDSLYAPVWYVVDPDDASHLIAVGSPADWEDKPWNTSFAAIAFGLIAFIPIASAWERFVPEDGRAVSNRLFPSRKPPGRRARDLTPRNIERRRHVR